MQHVYTDLIWSDALMGIWVAMSVKCDLGTDMVMQRMEKLQSHVCFACIIEEKIYVLT